MKNDEWLLLDLETSGKEAGRNEIIVLACTLLDENLEKIFDWEANIKPKYRNWWNDKSEEIHKISWKDAQKFEDQEKVFKDFTKRFAGYRDINFVCHAFPMYHEYDLFDLQFMRWFFLMNEGMSDWDWLFPRRCNFHSTILRSRSYANKYFNNIIGKHNIQNLTGSVLSNQQAMKDQKLGTWARFLKMDYQSHIASEDVRVLVEVFKHQYKIEETFEENRFLTRRRYFGNHS